MKFDYRKDYVTVKVEHKDLNEIKDTKHAQELAIVSKIMQLLNNGSYNDIEDFYNQNKNLQDFIKKYLEIPISHFGYNESPFNEEDYKNVIDNIRKIVEKKKSIDTSGISTATLGKDKYNTMKIDNKFQHIDSSNEDQKVEDRMRSVQETSTEFQSVNAKQNAEKTFQDIQNRQEKLEFSYLSEINPDSLNEEEKALLDVAIKFQSQYPLQIKVNIKKGIMVDEEGKIMKIDASIDETKIISDQDTSENSLETKEATYQKKLVPSTNTLYSN